jgi:hypothetical protein
MFEAMQKMQVFFAITRAWLHENKRETTARVWVPEPHISPQKNPLSKEGGFSFVLFIIHLPQADFE